MQHHDQLQNREDERHDPEPVDLLDQDRGGQSAFGIAQDFDRARQAREQDAGKGRRARQDREDEEQDVFTAERAFEFFGLPGGSALASSV